MSKLTMKTVRIIALRSDRKRLMEHLQDSALIHLSACAKPKEGFERIDTSGAVAAFERNADTADRALKVLDRFAPEKKGMLASFSGRRRIDEDEIGVYAQNAADTIKICNRILALHKQLAENAAQMVRIKTNITQLEPWEKLDIPFCTEQTKTTAVFIGSVPGEWALEELTAAVAERAPDAIVDIERQWTGSDTTCFVLFTPKEHSAQVQSALRELSFAKPMGANRSLPAEKMKRLRAQLHQLMKDEDKIKQDIVALAEHRRAIEETYDYYHIRADKYSAIGTLDHSSHVFVITGYVPEPDVEKVEALATRVATCTVEVFDADENAPVKLKNNAFTRPAQNIVTMYSTPSHGDIDPTPVLAVFFYLFFGMMFSDAGYGLVLALGSWILLKVFKPEQRMKDNLMLFFYSGLSTIVFGLIYGSIFGDAPVALYNHFNGTELTMADILPWPTIDTKTQAMPLLIVSIAFGLLHILVGMGCKFYILCRDHHVGDAICDVGFWMLLLIGVAVACVGMITVPIVVTVGAAIAVASVVGILVTGGRKKKGFGKVIGGVASLYDVTSYISDLLSYSRLLALGLTTGIMGQVFNTLSTMFGTSALSFIPMILIFILGHLITIGLNALGSYVHTMRLQYVELFSKFYEGGGQEFTPFALNSKYITIQED